MSLCMELTGLVSLRNIDQSSWYRDTALQPCGLINPSPAAAAPSLFFCLLSIDPTAKEFQQSCDTLKVAQLTVLAQ